MKLPQPASFEDPRALLSFSPLVQENQEAIGQGSHLFRSGGNLVDAVQVAGSRRGWHEHTEAHVAC